MFMKKYLCYLFFVIHGSLFSQCIPEPECGASNTISAFPKATSHWVKQTFSVEQSGYLEHIKMYVAVSGNVPSTMSFSVLSETEEVLFNDVLFLPATETLFLYCDTANWSSIYPENLFITEGEIYSFKIERLDADSVPWIIYSVNANSFSQGACTNDLNEVIGMPDASDPGSYDQMLPEEDCAFILSLNCSCLGDYNYDGTRSVADLIMLISAFGEFSEEIDITNDGLVTVSDLTTFIGVYGVPCP